MWKVPITIALPLILGGCGIDRAGCVTGTGDPIERVVPVAMFNGIVVEGSTDVEVVRGDTQQVLVIAQPELIDLLKTRVEGGVWTITTTRCHNSTEGIRLRLTVPMLNSVIVQGSGNVVSEQVFNTGKTHLGIEGSGSIAIDTLHEGLLDIAVEGSGSIALHGTCRELRYTSNGSGDLKAPGLVANSAEMELNGSGNAEVTVISTLNAELSGSGTLRYRGTPEVNTHLEGSGSVIAVP